MMTDQIAADGMKTAQEWQELGRQGQAFWLAHLDDLGVKAQASVIAATMGGGTVRAVVMAWVTLGVLAAERMAPVLAARVLR